MMSGLRTLIITLLLINASYAKAYSQSRIINGYVLDSLTGERLIGVNLYIPNSKTGTITNEFGFFSLKIPVNTREIRVSYVGYNVKKIPVNDTIDTFYELQLVKGIKLDEVIIKSHQSDFQAVNETGVIKIPMKSLYKMPVFVGEHDILHSLQLMPGIQSGSEGKASLYIRGGSPDQNLILIDDVPLYNTDHYGGFFSTFNSDAIKDYKLYKGGFPARYGSRLSSVVDIRLKDGDLTKYTVSGSLGLLSSKIMLEGPIYRGKSSLLISYRKNTFQIFRLIFDENLVYRFSDFNSKFNLRLNKKNRLLLSLYSGNDNVFRKENSKNPDQFFETNHYTRWGNICASMRLNSVYSSKVFNNTIIGYTNYHYKSGFESSYSYDTVYENLNSRFISRVNDIFIKVTPEVHIDPNYTLRFGGEILWHRFTPATTSFEQENSSMESNSLVHTNNDVNSVESNVFIENDVNIFKWLGCNIGLHYSGYIVQKKAYHSLEPRLLANIRLTPELSLKPAYSKMQQYVHLLTYSGVGMPSDFWIPSTALISPEHSNQVSVGIEYLLNRKYKFSIEAYQKHMLDLIAFNQGESFIGNSGSWENKIITGGQGLSEGIELLLSKDDGKFNGWIGLNFSKSVRKFAELNEGKPFPFKYDRRFKTDVVAIYNINDRISVSAVWKYGTGYPITLPVEKYDSYGNIIYIYSEINSYRMRNYHRLDLGANFNKTKKRGERTWSISILNVYNRQNPYYYFFKYEQLPLDNGLMMGVRNGNLKLYQQSFISFFPTVSYSFKFRNRN